MALPARPELPDRQRGKSRLGSDGEISRLGKEAASFPIPGMNEGQKTAVTAIVEDNKGTSWSAQPTKGLSDSTRHPERSPK